MSKLISRARRMHVWHRYAVSMLSSIGFLSGAN